MLISKTNPLPSAVHLSQKEVPQPATFNEKEILEDIFQEGTSQEKNQDRLDRIGAFLFKKLADFTARAPDAQKEIFLEEKPLGLEVSRFDADHCLVVVGLYLQGYDETGYLFLINRQNPDWIPLRLNQESDEGTYAVTSRNLFVEGPLISIWTGSCGWFGGFGSKFIYLFKEGALHLVASRRAFLNEEKAQGVDFDKEDISPHDYESEEIEYLDEKIKRLLVAFSPNGAHALKTSHDWDRIYLVKSPQAYFHTRPERAAQRASYLVAGDWAYVSEVQEEWMLAHYLPPERRPFTGWIRKQDLQSALQ